MKLCSRKIASGSAKIVCAIHTCPYEPPAFRPSKSCTSPIDRPRENSDSSGTRAICSGTICSAKTAMKSTFLPLKSIQANAYAASAAIVSGKTVAGRVIAIELTNASPSVNEVEPGVQHVDVVLGGEARVREDRPPAGGRDIAGGPERRDEQAERRHGPHDGDDQRGDGGTAAGEPLLGALGRGALAGLLAAPEPALGRRIQRQVDRLDGAHRISLCSLICRAL